MRPKVLRLFVTTSSTFLFLSTTVDIYFVHSEKRLCFSIPNHTNTNNSKRSTTFLPSARLEFSTVNTMREKERIATALMEKFAQRTGLADSSHTKQIRYLWTDAFAVCNYLGLARSCVTQGDERGRIQFENLALQLVDSVHHILGTYNHHGKSGEWISGLSEGEGQRYPTIGGLRIGEKRHERRLKEPYDSQAEWDRDGQYFHYLTKWMVALDQVARYSFNPEEKEKARKYNVWARELGVTAVRGFVHPSHNRMYWKMSVDLSRPLVLSQGGGDPLDGYVTLERLLSTNRKIAATTENVDDVKTLDSQVDVRPTENVKQGINHLMPMLVVAPTSDPLGIGCMLIDAYRVHTLLQEGAIDAMHLLEDLLECSLVGLHHYNKSGELTHPVQHRLGFRELGLSIGLHAIENLKENINSSKMVSKKMQSQIARIDEFQPMGKEIMHFWLDPENQQSDTWKEHIDINEVMLATSLVPHGFLSDAFGLN